MHFRILLKVRGKDVIDAERQAQAIMEDTLRCDKCERSINDINWDYVGDIDCITPQSLKKFREKELQELKKSKISKNKLFWVWKTPEEMAAYYVAQRAKAMIQLKKLVEEEIRNLIIERLMTVKEAPLYIADRRFQKRAEELLKSGKNIPDPKFPDSRKSLVRFTSDLLTEGWSYVTYLFHYLFRCVERLSEVMEYGDADKGLYTLHCTHNHYSDMTKETEGDRVFFFWIDRHY